MSRQFTRRTFLALGISTTGVICARKWMMPAQAQQILPNLGVQTGDVTANSAVIWSRSDQAARMIVYLSKSPRFRGQVVTRYGPEVGTETDYTGKLDLTGLQPGTTYYYQVFFASQTNSDGGSTAPIQGLIGRFQTAPADQQADPVKFVWAADMAGQGWGRNPNLQITGVDGEVIQGGYVIFDVMRKLKPDFAIFCGDMIYADNPMPPTKDIPAIVGGGTWINDPPKDYVAITLEQFRGNWKYNLEDSKFARFLAETPVYVQWDDHEVTNNWYPGEILTAAPYNGIPADDLAARARQSFFEYNPIRGNRIERNYRYGRHLELFLLDERTYRGPNDKNTEPFLEMLGAEQFQALKQRLKASQATWKVISTHDPLSIVTGGPGDYDAWAQNDSQVLGREAQLRDLLKFIKAKAIKNVVWITADVHFPAAIYYDPTQAVFQDFDPFWEFVIGPIHAGAFGPSANLPLDPSFGPRYEFSVFPPEANLPPPHNHFFGAIDIAGRTAELTARIYKITGEIAYEKVLKPRS
jgi:alkaline phosphatase D